MKSLRALCSRVRAVKKRADDVVLIVGMAKPVLLDEPEIGTCIEQVPATWQSQLRATEPKS
jgi:hypothetical protein